MFQTVFKRYEKKYLLDSEQYRCVKDLLSYNTVPDEYGESLVCNIYYDTPDSAKVRLVLKNAEISNANGPAIYIKSADKVFITAYKGTENTVSDGASYSSDYDGTNVDAAVFSKADLTLNGEGVLNINGNYKCAAVSKDDLIICGLTLNAKSVGSAIEGKDRVKIKDAAITVNSGADAIKSTNSEDADRGFVYIESGTCTLTAAKDGIQADPVIRTVQTARLRPSFRVIQKPHSHNK